jgi:uncharacterized protein (DUF433 family)
VIGADVVQEREGVCGGYPCVGNSRIPVRSLVIAYRQTEGNVDLVIETFPTLTPEQICGALAWYADHPSRVDEDIERNDRALSELSQS